MLYFSTELLLTGLLYSHLSLVATWGGAIPMQSVLLREGMLKFFRVAFLVAEDALNALISRAKKIKSDFGKVPPSFTYK